MPNNIKDHVLVASARTSVISPAWILAGEGPKDSGKIGEIPLKRIAIEDKFWSPRLEVNRTKTLDHVYKELESTGCIRNFDIAAKKATGGFGGPWWADSDVYKWIEGASYVLGSHPDPELERKVDDLISRIAAVQEPDGYLNTHVQIEEPDLRFRDLAFFHEDFSSGHLFEAAVAHYQATGKRTLLDWPSSSPIALTRLLAPESATAFRAMKESSSRGSASTGRRERSVTCSSRSFT